MIRLLGCLFLLTLILLGCNVFSPLSPAGNDTSRNALLDDAQSSLKSGEYTQAAHYYQEAADLYGQCSAARMGCSRCRFLLRLDFTDMANMGARLEGENPSNPGTGLAQGTPLVDPTLFHFPAGDGGIVQLRTWLDSSYQDMYAVFYRPSDGTADTANDITPHVDFSMLGLMCGVVWLETRAQSFRVIWYTSDQSYHLEYNPSDLPPTDPLVDSVYNTLRLAEDQAIWALDHARVDKRNVLRMLRDQCTLMRREMEIYRQL
jgi:hypothetical protein